MGRIKLFASAAITRDLTAGAVVFLVALPLCLGIALASGAPLISGVLTGIIGGILVGSLSGSHTSVSGPAAGLTAIIAAQIAALGSFEALLLAVVVGGLIQIALGVVRAGFIAAFFPSSVIKGLLAAIGVILILKQIPHIAGHDLAPEGEMAFAQLDRETTFSELGKMLENLHAGAAMIGLASVIVLVGWDRCQRLKNSLIPAPLVVVLLGTIAARLFGPFGPGWAIEASHLVQVPIADSLPGFVQFLRTPDFSQWANPAVYAAGVTLAVVASLETLLNVEAVDKLDPQKRVTPPSRELLVQGIGNVVAGMIGGIPMTSVIVRSSVNIQAGGQTRLAAVVHGVLLLICVVLLPGWLNLIPLSCLAAILLVTGVKLVSPKLIVDVWKEGRYQFIPFAVTLASIVLSDLLIGVLIGLATSLGFILNSNLRRPIRRIVENHVGGEVLRIELANQVSFLNRAALENILQAVPNGGQVLLDARQTDYIDPDVLSLIRDFKDQIAPTRGIQVSLRDFRTKYRLRDEIQYVDYTTRELQDRLTPVQVLRILQEGNERFRTGRRLSRDLCRQLHATAENQYPLAAVLSCIDSRTPAELIFDLGLGDIFSVRVAGNVTSPKVLGSLEYGCAVAGAKLILVLGHTRCGAVTTAVELATSMQNAVQATGCQHLEPIIREIQQSINLQSARQLQDASAAGKAAFIDAVARRNVQRAAWQIVDQSQTISGLLREGRIALIGAIYDVATGMIDYLTDDAVGLQAVGEATAQSE